MLEQGKGKTRLIFIQTVFWCIGIFAIGYYIVILSLLGFRKDFSLIWPAGAAVFIGSAILLAKLSVNHLKGANKLGSAITAVLLTSLVILAVLEGTIIKNGFTKPDKDADYLIVLGAQINGTRVSKALRYRLDEAYKYAMENKDTKVIVSGGQGTREDISEAEAMSDYLEEKGLEKERIIIEDKSTNTNENIKYSKQLMRDADYVVVVTNRFHLYRGVRIARKQLDQKVEGLGAATGTALFINYYFREAFAVVKDYIVHNI